ncbi:MAG: EscU/YscU/HrcU family type III secretion system export apparatus switch protein [Gammaproteobacteria bacterium]
MTDINEHKQDLAVALNYDGKNAPKITAKGQNEIARQILEKAEEADVPLKYDPELAAILSQIPLGEEIPESLYRAVAEVIAFAYFIAGKTPEQWASPDNHNKTDKNKDSD